MTNDKDLGTAAQLQDPNYEVPMGPRIALGMQHVLAMFASNVTPSIIIAGAAGFAFGGTDTVFLIQMAMLFCRYSNFNANCWLWACRCASASYAGYQLCFRANYDNYRETSGVAALFGAVVVAGIFHALLGSIIGKYAIGSRSLLPA